MAALRAEAGGEAGAPSGTPLDQEDPASREGAGEVARSLLETEGRVLAEAVAALDRIEKRTFGRCDRCGGPIARSRLDALPYARHCVTCARAAEAGGE